MKLNILHLDDDPMMLMKIHSALQLHPFGMSVSYRGTENTNDFFSSFNQQKPDCVLLDLMLGEHCKQGVMVLERLRSSGFFGAVIVISSIGSAEEIATCIESGADDFITKGLSGAELSYRIIHASKRKGAQPQSMVEAAGETMSLVSSKIKRIINSPISSTLIRGESGTGKEVVSQLFKATLGPKIPFISVDCGAIPASLMEAEFFGHTKGSFTGANSAREGYFKAADGGWLFLDEIGNLSYTAQGALLRVLETGELKPIGSSLSTRVNVRIIAATNLDLSEKVSSGDFRGDLLERLRTYEIVLPPLRTRPKKERVEILEYLMVRLNNLCKTMGLGTEYRLTAEARQILTSYSWKDGNIREMWNSLQSASVEAEDGFIKVGHLPKRLHRSLVEKETKPMEDRAEERQGATTGSTDVARASANLVEFPSLQKAMVKDVPLSEIIEEVEKNVIFASLQRHHDRQGSYEGLGISRSSLNQKRNKYDL